MRLPLQRFFYLQLPLWCSLTAGAVWSHGAYSVMLERYNQDIQGNPQNYLKRAERAYLILEHQDTSQASVEDIDTLLSHPQWRNEGVRLKAIRLHLQGRFDEAAPLIQQNIRDNIYLQEQARLLADIELSKKDTAAAITAYRAAWEHDSDETDYIDLLNLHQGRGKPPEELLRQGLNFYPRSPGAVQSIFEVYFAAGDPASLKTALEISGRADSSLWPFSVDWKIRHAQVLLSLKRAHDAEPVLMAALDLLDGDARMKVEDGEVIRKQIFTLLEASRK